MLCSALKSIDIDTFNIVLFGETVQVVKFESQPFDGATILGLLSNVQTDKHCGSADAHAINCSLELLSSSQAKERMMFVLTDGYGSCGAKLNRVLHRAAQEHVPVTGITVGDGDSLVPTCYSRWIKCAVPSLLPRAFRRLHEGVHTDEDGCFKDVAMLLEGGADSIRNILRNPTANFPGISKMFEAEREINLVHGSSLGSMTLDICWVFDVTGSMGPFIEGVKAQMRGVADKILPKIQEDYPNIQLITRHAVVAYRDISDTNQFERLEFTEDVDLLDRFIHQLKASGGGDVPEDVAGALRESLDRGWSGKARFCVLVTDAPGHGFARQGAKA